MHWGSIKIPCLRLTQWYLQRRSIKSPKRYFKVYALRVWVFFLSNMGASMLAKVIASMSKLLFTFVLFSHRQFAIFRSNAFIFSYGASLCAQLLYASRAISPFLFISLWFRFVFSVVILQRYNVCFSYRVRAGAWLGIGAWPGGSKWEAIIWSAAVENEDHDDEGHSLLGFKRGW